MALINLVLQGKGGVGKSYVASLLAQYYAAHGSRTVCFDTDPVNQTFAGYKAFNVESVRLGEKADQVDPGYFDTLIEKMMAADGDEPAAETVVVVDNGASNFLPFIGYLVESNAVGMLVDEAAHVVRLHTVVTGGPALKDTVEGLAQILTYLPDVPVVVWLNEYFGRVEIRKADGTTEGFEQSALYCDNRSRIDGLVRLHGVRRETFGRDIEQMMAARLSFAEAIKSPDFAVMSKQRLKMTWRVLYHEMDGQL